MPNKPNKLFDNLIKKLKEIEIEPKVLHETDDERIEEYTLPVEFFENQRNIKNINCYSNDGGNWKKSSLSFENNILTIDFDEKFIPRRGRINCSLNDNGKWRWFGTQFVIMKD